MVRIKGRIAKGHGVVVLWAVVRLKSSRVLILSFHFACLLALHYKRRGYSWLTLGVTCPDVTVMAYRHAYHGTTKARYYR
eukprot:938532-Amorphochlora_amoeboformis.AAC.1